MKKILDEMKFEYQVCTPEQGKKLEKLGVTAKSYFVWVSDPVDPKKWMIMERWIFSEDQMIPAWSCAELGVMLPAIIRDDNKAEHFLKMERKGELYVFQYKARFLNLFDAPTATNKHEAYAKADLAIYIVEQKIIEPEDLNYI